MFKSPKIILSTVAATVVLATTYSLIFSVRSFALASSVVQLLLVLSPTILTSIILWLGLRSRSHALVVSIAVSVCMAALFTTLNFFVNDWLAGLILFPLTLGTLALCELILSNIRQKWLKATLLVLLCVLLWVMKIAITIWFFYQMRA